MDVPSGPTSLRLNLGAGRTPLAGYLSVDLQGDPDILADVRRIPVRAGTVDEIMAIHLFEHLPRWDAEPTLTHWLRLLKPGGLLVLELPDLIKCCQNVIDGKPPRAGLWGLFGSPEYRQELMLHRWCWSGKELRDVLREVGFSQVRILEPQFHKKYRDMRLEATA